MDGSADASAIITTAHDNVFDAQHIDGVLQRTHEIEVKLMCTTRLATSDDDGNESVSTGEAEAQHRRTHVRNKEQPTLGGLLLRVQANKGIVEHAFLRKNVFSTKVSVATRGELQARGVNGTSDISSGKVIVNFVHEGGWSPTSCALLSHERL